MTTFAPPVHKAKRKAGSGGAGHRRESQADAAGQAPPPRKGAAAPGGPSEAKAAARKAAAAARLQDEALLAQAEAAAAVLQRELSLAAQHRNRTLGTGGGDVGAQRAISSPDAAARPPASAGSGAHAPSRCAVDRGGDFQREVDNGRATDAHTATQRSGSSPAEGDALRAAPRQPWPAPTRMWGHDGLPEGHIVANEQHHRSADCPSLSAERGMGGEQTAHQQEANHWSDIHWAGAVPQQQPHLTHADVEDNSWRHTDQHPSHGGMGTAWMPPPPHAHPGQRFWSPPMPPARPQAWQSRMAEPAAAHPTLDSASTAVPASGPPLYSTSGLPSSPGDAFRLARPQSGVEHEHAGASRGGPFMKALAGILPGPSDAQRALADERRERLKRDLEAQINEKRQRDAARKAREEQAQQRDEQMFQNYVASQQQQQLVEIRRRAELANGRRRSAIGGSLAEDPPPAPHGDAQDRKRGAASPRGGPGDLAIQSRPHTGPRPLSDITLSANRAVPGDEVSAQGKGGAMAASRAVVAASVGARVPIILQELQDEQQRMRSQFEQQMQTLSQIEREAASAREQQARALEELQRMQTMLVTAGKAEVAAPAAAEVVLDGAELGPVQSYMLPLDVDFIPPDLAAFESARSA